MTIASHLMKVLKDHEQMIDHDQKYGGESKIFKNRLTTSNRDGSVTYVIVETRYPGWEEWSADMYRRLGFAPPLRPDDV